MLCRIEVGTFYILLLEEFIYFLNSGIFVVLVEVCYAPS